MTFWQLYGFFVRSDFSHYLVTPKNTPEKTPVLLIPGIYESWQFMKPVADFLYANEYPVHIVSELGYNRDDLETMAEAVMRYVKANNLKKYSIVAHSKGGLIAKLLLNRSKNITKVVALNTPFEGSRYAYLTPIKSLRIFLPHSAELSKLSSYKTVNKKIVSIYGVFDPHIPKGSYLDGATNIQLSTRGHFRIMNNYQVHQAILEALK